MNARTTILALLLAICAASISLAQGVLVVTNHPHPIPLPRPIIIVRPQPQPEISYRIKELAIQARVSDQVAQVNVSQTFVNTGSQQIQVEFVFPLPPDSAINKLTFMVDGREIEAKLLPAKEARSIYEQYVRRNQDPALLEWVDFGMVRTSVFPIPAGAERKVLLHYDQLLRKEGNLVDFLFPLATAKYTSQAVEKVQVQLAIESTEPIKSVYSPNYPVEITRSDERHAKVDWQASNVIPSSDFRLFFDTNPGTLSASVVSYRPEKNEDGYFLLLATPEMPAQESTPTKKTVVFVVDRSGSMSGKKIEQAKEALKFVLNNLREGDLFNIVAYDSDVEAFRPELQGYDDESRQAALGFVDGIYAGGSTNIDDALTTTLEMLKDDERPNYVLFLTDGLPTAGEQNEAKIVDNSEGKNKVDARLISFGVGYDVNSRLLDRLANAHQGASQYVRPDEDLEQHVSQLYSRISAPVMTDVAIKFDLEGAGSGASAINRQYPASLSDLFAGQQLVLVGRYKTPGDAKVTVTGKVAGDPKSFDFAAKFVEYSSEASNGFVEKLWAVRRIGEIIDELDLKGKNQELIDELVALSTKHGILTPYTSFLADENQTGSLAGIRQNREAEDRLALLDETSGRRAFSQRAVKQQLRKAESLASGLGGLPGMRGAAPTTAPGAAMPGGVVPRASGLATVVQDLETGEAIVTTAVQSVGKETLYRRGKLWIATNARDVDPEKDKDKIQEIEKFSDEYFALIKANTPAENALLAVQQADEQLLLRLRGQTYLIK